MKHLKFIIAGLVVAACLTSVLAAPQSEKQPVMPENGRFGDPTGTARKYEGYTYGVIKEIKPNELVLTKTKAGVDQGFKLVKKTKFSLDGKPSSLDKLKVGEGVYIDTDTDKKTGDLIAKKVVSGIDIPTIPTSTP